MNVALFGGTFNPVHNGHVTVAQEVRRLLSVDQVVFIPAHCPPHKTDAAIIASHHRLEMLKRAVHDLPYCTISSIEIAKQEVCYTIDTVRELKQGSPEWDTVYFIVGSDAIPFIYNWQAAETLFSEVQIVVLKRPGFDSSGHDDRFLYLENAEYESASSDIRAKLRSGAMPVPGVPEPVARYIREQGLYQ